MDWNTIADERNSTNVVQKRFYAQGEQQSGTAYFYTKDHLGSIRELISSTGTIVARYNYDVYGKVSLEQGANLAAFQYAGYYQHQISGLYLTKYRAYDSNTRRWLTRDPLFDRNRIILENFGASPAYGLQYSRSSKGFDQSQGVTWDYNYVIDNPVTYSDQLGLFHMVFGWMGPVEARCISCDWSGPFTGYMWCSVYSYYDEDAKTFPKVGVTVYVTCSSCTRSRTPAPPRPTGGLF